MTRYHQQPILVPTDLSAASASAVQVARTLAGGDEHVTVVSVGLHHDLVAPAHIWGLDAIELDNTDERRQMLQQWVQEHNLGDVRQELRCGDAGLEICELAKEISSPLIVIPSHGRSGIGRVLLGSVAERVIRHADCSVLVLRRNEDGATDAVEEWLPRRKVLVPVDLSESTGLAIETAHQLVDDAQNLTVINVVSTFSDALVTGAGVNQEDMRDARRNKLQESLEQQGWKDLNTKILFGDPGLTISEYATEANCDLVVIPSHGFHGVERLLLGSTTERVIRHTHCPVLVLRRHDAN